MQTLADFIKTHQIRMTATRIPARTDALMDMPNARHWNCYLHRIGYGPSGQGWEGIAIEYSQGSAHTKAPTCADILDCLASDDTRGQYFEDWASDIGYDTDSRKAYATWEACKSSGEKLLKLLGHEAHRDLLDNVERL